jgi:ribosomal protein S18 acetylase RimI-like enzyme
MNTLLIRSYNPEDEKEVVNLWFKCNLLVPHNNPRHDIERKLKTNPEWFLVGVLDGEVVATCMVGYEGHRGWINYLAVSPHYQRRGIATRLIKEAERRLRAVGCPKINLQVRASNKEAITFYERIGYSKDDVVGMGKRLEHDEPYSVEPVDAAIPDKSRRS